MTPLRYFSLRSYMGPPASDVPVLVLGALALCAVVGLLVDLGVL